MRGPGAGTAGGPGGCSVHACSPGDSLVKRRAHTRSRMCSVEVMAVPAGGGDPIHGSSPADFTTVYYP